MLWPEDTATLPPVRATTYTGYLSDSEAGGAMSGTIQVKVGKPNRGTGVSKITVTIRIPGEKTITVKGTTSTGAFKAEAGGVTLDLQLRENSFIGTFGSYSLDGVRDVFASGDTASKAAAEQTLNRWLGSYAIAWRASDAGGWNSLTVEVKKRGRVKVTGTFVDGARVSEKKMLVGEKECVIAVSWANRKSSMSLLLWLCEDGTVECLGLPDGATAVAAPVRNDAAGLVPEAVFGMDVDTLSAAMPELLTMLLPNGMDLRSAKDSPAALKLRYKAKDGSFKGTFKAYATAKGRLRVITVNVTGVVVDGVGYGRATLKKPAASWSVRVE